MKVSDFEDKVWEVDGIRLTLRLPANSEVGDYDWQNAADQGWSVKKDIDTRIIPKINGAELVIIDGEGEEPNRRTLLRTTRKSYDK